MSVVKGAIMENTITYLLFGMLFLGCFVILVLTIRKMQILMRIRNLENAKKLFRLQREQLEAKFFDMAASLGKPRGLRWVNCEWQNDVSFARDKLSGLLTAFVSISIRFEAIEGSDMEEVEAVGLLREAAAVFHFKRNRWGTGGRAMFNMDSETAVTRLAGQYERIEN